MIENKLVSEVMTSDVITITKEATLKHFRDHFKNRGIHHLLVEKKGELIGMISSEDAAKASSWILEQSVVASYIMTTDLKTVKPNDSLVKVINIFLSKNYRALPVIDENNKIKGIITPYDILKQIAFES